MIRIEEMLTASDIALLETAVAVPPDTIDYSALGEDES